MRAANLPRCPRIRVRGPPRGLLSRAGGGGATSVGSRCPSLAGDLERCFRLMDVALGFLGLRLEAFAA